jgi:hypothetical protein
MPYQIAGLIKLENRRRLRAAIACLPVGGGFVSGKCVGAMNDPHVILSIHRHADRHTDVPVVGQWLGPKRVDLESGRHNNSTFDDHRSVQQTLSDEE